MFYALTVFYVLVCFLLLLVVLLQRGKGGGMAAFGGGGTDTAFGARAGATTILAALFMIISLALGIMWRTGGGSVVSGVGGPAPAAQTPAPQQPQ